MNILDCSTRERKRRLSAHERQVKVRFGKRGGERWTEMQKVDDKSLPCCSGIWLSLFPNVSRHLFHIYDYYPPLPTSRLTLKWFYHFAGSPAALYCIIYEANLSVKKTEPAKWKILCQMKCASAVKRSTGSWVKCLLL